MKATSIAIWTLVLLTACPVLADFQVGEPVDDFTLLDLQGNPVSLSDFSGQVVLINFFATWCPPCNEEVPLLEEMWQNNRDQGFVVLGIDLLENPALVADWVQFHTLTYPIVISPDWSLFQLFPQAGGFPYNAVVDQVGVLQYAQYGINMEEINEQVQGLLLVEPVAKAPTSFGAIKALYR